MNLAAIFLLCLVFGLLFYDYATMARRARRMLRLEAFAFLVGAFFIAFPDAATAVAHRVGIGRGVDFLLYPLVIWLARESLRNRRLRWEDNERLTKLVRAQAIAGAREVGADGGAGEDASPPVAGDRRAG
jgi:hypothetical protein